MKLKNQNHRPWNNTKLVCANMLLIVALGAVSGMAHPTQSTGRDADLKQFTGTWEGKFEGKTFVTVKLEIKDRKLTGTISEFKIMVDPSGSIGEVEGTSANDAIADAKVSDKVLTFPVKVKGTVSAGDSQVESTSELRWEIKLTSDNQAELRMVGTPAGGPSIAPFKLERISR
jgi:hypothetical protein